MQRKAREGGRSNPTPTEQHHSAAPKTCDWREKVGLPQAAPLGASGVGTPEFNPKLLPYHWSDLVA